MYFTEDELDWLTEVEWHIYVALDRLSLFQIMACRPIAWQMVVFCFDFLVLGVIE